MNYTQELEKEIFKRAGLISIFLVLLSLILKDKIISLGIITGFFIGVFHFKMIVLSVKKFLNFRREGSIKVASFLGCVLRFFLLGFLFWQAATVSLKFLGGTAAGFFTIKAAIILEGLSKRLKCQA